MTSNAAPDDHEGVLQEGSLHDGLLLVGHGTRDPQGAGEFLAAAAGIAAFCPAVAVEACFLELARPTIPEGLAALYGRGVRRPAVVPLLLFDAGHAKRDIPEQVVAAASTWSDLQVVRYTAPLGCHPALLWLSELRYREALTGRPARSSDTLLVMIGRGSNDAEATAEMRRFAALRCERTPVGKLEVGFLAMACPTLDEVLQAARQSSYSRVVVQPHLLFRGQLLDEVRQAAKRAAAESPQQEWVVTAQLGPGKPLARAVHGMLHNWTVRHLRTECEISAQAAARILKKR